MFLTVMRSKRSHQACSRGTVLSVLSEAEADGAERTDGLAIPEPGSEKGWEQSLECIWEWLEMLLCGYLVVHVV